MFEVYIVISIHITSLSTAQNSMLLINTFVACFKSNCLDDWQQETMAKLV